MVTGIPFSPGKTSRNSRLPSPIAVQVKEKKPTRSNRVEGRYLVADLNGKEFELKVWQKTWAQHRMGRRYVVCAA